MRRCPCNSASDDREDDDEPPSLCRAVHILAVTMRDSFAITFNVTGIRPSYSPLAQHTSARATWSPGTVYMETDSVLDVLAEAQGGCSRPRDLE
jgi:hypothetical protein